MHIFTFKKDLGRYLSTLSNNNTIGFIPTMGCLHEGHLRLIKKSKKKCSLTICSIFINPTQFDNINDLTNYPKKTNADIKKLKKVACDIVYVPEIHDLYTNEIKVKKFDFGTLVSTMEGKFRPEHFNGVATIIEKLFTIIQPTMAFFGEKDLQQLQIIKILTQQINSPIEIVGVPTVREKNGLAKSSRNELLSENEREEAALINECLKYCKKNKSKGIAYLKNYIEQIFNEHVNLKLEYIEFVKITNMCSITEWGEEKSNAVCIAAYINNIRLIDNIIL